MANFVLNMLLKGQKDPTRRAMLDWLSVSVAAVSVLVLLFPAALAGDTSINSGAEHRGHPVLMLPFAPDTTAEERSSGAAPRSLWHVAATGGYNTDCSPGARDAALGLDYMLAANAPQILQWAVFDMKAAGRTRSGMKVGFMSAFGRIAMPGHSDAALVEGAVA